MGKLARLNAQGKVQKKKWFIIVIKRDFSYEQVEELEGAEKELALILKKPIKVTKKIENYLLLPMGKSILSPSIFSSVDEANNYLKDFVNDPKMGEKELEIILVQDFHILDVKYVPTNRKPLGPEWAKANLIQDIPTDIKTKQSSQLL